MRQDYLQVTEIIDWEHPTIIELCKTILKNSKSKNEYIEKAFVFVRDQIKHSWDYKLNPLTCRASDVLKHKTGYCYAKSHLLAALLRANQIPTGFCYQRLRLGGDGARYSLHGLNAVFLEEYGWYRVDARGNKPGVNAQFTPPNECLAFKVKNEFEKDFSEIWPSPLSIVVEALEGYKSVEEMYENLPDIEVVK